MAEVTGSNRGKVIIGSAVLLSFLFAATAVVLARSDDVTTPTANSVPRPQSLSESTVTTPELQNSGSSNNSNFSSVTVNGQDMAVPANGSLNRTISDGSNQTDVHIEHHSNTSSGGASNSNSSNLEINVDSSSEN